MTAFLDRATFVDSVNISPSARIVGIFGSGLLIPPSRTQRFLLSDPSRAVIVGTFSFLSPGPVSRVAVSEGSPTGERYVAEDHISYATA